MKKKVFLLLGLLLGFSMFSGTGVFASNDCSLVTTHLQGNEDSHKIKFGMLYSDEAFNKALMNLKAFCCNSNAYALKTDEVCGEDSDYFVEYYPESDYLYDHLIDIALRRLDAVGDIYGLVPDTVAYEWREYIKDIGDDPNPGFALAMKKKYETYWSTKNSKYTEYTDGWIKKMTDDEIFALSKKYKEANLYQRYIESCGIAAQIYIKYTTNESMIAYNYCKDMVNQRISNELLYTKVQMADKSSKLLHKSVESYLTNYFAKNRLINLQETVLFVSDLFLSIAKMVPEGTRECN